MLDELEQQAQQRKANADDAGKRRAEREEIFRTQLDPGMTALHEFLGKLIGNLKVLQPKKQLRYNLAGYDRGNAPRLSRSWMDRAEFDLETIHRGAA